MTDNELFLIANGIWQQLGAQRFELTTGCRPITYGEDGSRVYLLMSVGENSRAIKGFEVSSDGDSYEVRFLRERDGQTKVVSVHKEVCPDMIHTLFTQHTGIAA